MSSPKTIAIGLGMIIIGIIIGGLWGACERHPSATEPTINSRINPTTEQMTALQKGREAIVNEELVPRTTCIWAETENGFRYNCGPAHVDPADCNDGFIKICIRRYGNRICDCYPE